MSEKEKDVQIVMDTKIVQQILKTIPENMNNQINIVMVNQVDQGNGKDFDFWTFLEGLPEPRMARLKEMAVKIAMKMNNGNKIKASNFLGITSRNLYPSRLHQDMVKGIE